MGNMIKEHRRKQGMTQTELAKQVGVAQTSIAQWETGRTHPRTTLLPKLAAALHCTVDALLSNADDKETA